ncbi:MAG: DUF4446 family protein [Peptococcaceae bacterium]|jgi:hypothetical protein|nr:DUF4446 family protein [Peptococcaceae bacterium]MDH7523809.1 DUF4446 family protein [Peptococcaceae bacterium]
MLQVINDLIYENYALIAIVLIVLFAAGLALFLAVIFRLNKLARQYRALMRGMDGKNIEQIVLENANILENLQKKLAGIETQLKEVERLNRRSIHNVSLLRFNAFHDMGGDLSFALALLNHDGDGVVISSIYGRDDARTYAKPVKGGKSTYHFSQEEEKVIALALSQENDENNSPILSKK